jgi:hypothetical protein
MPDLLLRLAIAAAVLVGGMIFAFIVRLATGRSGWIDVLWCLSVGAAGEAALWLANDAMSERAVLASALVVAPGRAHRAPIARVQRRSAIRQPRRRMGPFLAQQAVRLPDGSGGGRLDSGPGRHHGGDEPCALSKPARRGGPGDRRDRARRRSDRGPATGAMAKNSPAERHLRRRPLATISPPQLFLRMAFLVQLAPARGEHRATLDGPIGAHGPAPHGPFAGERVRRAAAGGAHGPYARPSLVRLLRPNAAVLAEDLTSHWMQFRGFARSPV